MADMQENTNHIEEVTREPRITASKQLWATFDEWSKLRGHQRLPEGIRAAMVEVTKFNPESQAKTTAQTT